jgi:Zn-finger nucleic acid-binding protein
MLCPRCEQGNLMKVTIRHTGAVLFVCPECEATWFNENDVDKKPFVDFGTYMESIGLQPLWTELVY